VDYVESLRGRGARSLAVFGDSITVGLNASSEEASWPGILAASAGIVEVRNRAISGTILQGSSMANGAPRPDHGRGRYAEALLGEDRADAIAILYGYNDARYIAAPQSINPERFRRDYSQILQGILAAGYDPTSVAIGSPPYIPTMGFGVGSEGFAGQTRSGFEHYVQVVRELAAQFSVFYAPVYERMAAYGDGVLASPDITHPNDAGHRVIAHAFIEAIRIKAA